MDTLLRTGTRETAQSQWERRAALRTSGHGRWRLRSRAAGTRAVRAHWGGRWIAVAGLAVAGLAMPAQSAAGDEAVDATRLVEEAQASFLVLAADPQMSALHALVPRARAIFIAPQVVRAAVVVGASAGTGILVVRDERTGVWRGPAFYTLGGASVGLQLGADASSVVVLAMTERGATAVVKPSLQVGVDASVALGPMGVGVEGTTPNLSTDLVAFSRARGLYGGVSLKGATLAARPAWNQAYYGRPLTPTDILVRGQGANLQGETLIATVQRVVRRSAERDRATSEGSGAQASTTPSPRPTLGGSRTSSRVTGGS
jgi:SH3 domain-containing YSC84-like protein 1